MGSPWKGTEAGQSGQGQAQPQAENAQVWGVCGRSRGPETPETHTVWQGGVPKGAATLAAGLTRLCLPSQASPGAHAGGWVDGAGTFLWLQVSGNQGQDLNPLSGHKVPGAAHGAVSLPPVAARIPHAGTCAMPPARWAGRASSSVTTPRGRQQKGQLHPSGRVGLRGREGPPRARATRLASSPLPQHVRWHKGAGALRTAADKLRGFRPTRPPVWAPVSPPWDGVSGLP